MKVAYERMEMVMSRKMIRRDWMGGRKVRMGG
jgi:hypothetical protein